MVLAGKTKFGFLLLSAVVLLTAGCGANIVEPLGSTPPTPVVGTLTGNWQLTTTTTAGTPPFSGLSGAFLLESGTAAGTNTVESILQADTPGTCYQGQTAIPSQGSLSGSALSQTSFSVSGQYLSTSATLASSQEQMTGNFSIADGCAAGVKGTFTGQKIASATGQYSGTAVPGPASLVLSLTQDANSDGLGFFHLSGTATFSGISCFNAGNVQTASSYVSGQGTQVTITTNEATPSTVVALGTLSVDANTLTLRSFQITSGNCAGSQGTVTLSH